jgi:hypothetical protein
VLLVVAPISLLQAGRSDPAQYAGGRFREAAVFLDEAEFDRSVLVIDPYLSPFWLFLLNHNGAQQLSWTSLPLPGETFKPREVRLLHAGIEGLSAYESIWIVSENSEFQISENFDLVSDLLEGYELATIEGFGDRETGAPLVFFHFQK